MDTKGTARAGQFDGLEATTYFTFVLASAHEVGILSVEVTGGNVYCVTGYKITVIIP